MNFFEAQDRARRKTSWLVFLFVAAIVGLILLTNLFLLGLVIYVKTNQVTFSPEIIYDHYGWKDFALVTTGVGLFILGGSLYKALSLSGGGPAIAEMLGGRLISQASTDPQHRQLLNVVDEMAIAAGMPIPQVYLLDDTSINAFAAGLTPASAVIGVTKGALMRFNRAELQAVIAHEFSHIANGDMRLNIRLIGILHGILLIGMLGYFLFRSLRYAGRSRNGKGGGGIVAIAGLGLGLMIIGYAGSFFGEWIKSSVSRQREYLADSSAVQFTRSKDGIAGALKKIGGAEHVGSLLESPAAPEYSHAYFATGVSSLLQSMFATHPPLESRIREIDPSWDGQFLASKINPVGAAEIDAEPASNATNIAITAAILSSAEQAISQVGTLNEGNIDYVHQLIVAMPMKLRESAQDAYSARALIYAVLLRLQKDKTAAQAAIARHADPDLQGLVDKFLPELNGLGEEFTLVLLELSVNALRELSPNQFVQFKLVVHELIVSDKSVNLREWVVQRFLIQQLDEHFGFRKPARAKFAKLEVVAKQAAIVLSLIAYIEHKDDNDASLAFNAGADEAGIDSLEILPRNAFKLTLLDGALDRLTGLQPLVKPRFLRACVAIILYDGDTTPRGIELVRTISTCLDCPMPPMQPV